MTRYLLDTSCLVAAVCTWHEHHDATVADIVRRTNARHQLVLAAPSLVETYAVLTRLPPPHRLTAADAWTLLDANWRRSTVVALTASDTWNLLRQNAAEQVAGGLTYDAVIAACARKARVEALVTWNVAHFERVSGDLVVTSPDTRLP